MKVAIIGAGNMGGAIARGIAEHNPEMQLSVANRTRSKLDALSASCPSISATTDNAVAVGGADIVILAVKPWVMPGAVGELLPILDAGQAIVSVAGGISLDDLDKMLGGREFQTFQVIPNTAISVGRSMTFMTCRRSQRATLDKLRDIFGTMGEVAVVEERLMGAATALCSCGIAYVYKYVQACVQAGVQMGFYPADAQRYVQATMQGALELLKANGTDPQTEIDRVTTPGGMTIKGINMLEHSGFSSAVIKGNLAPLGLQ